ncbi:pancreatic triacylglycerol lipase-like isoform X2 [Cylas formicarius]|uniref:pancreatic triacylglycerol lipase-like isoform X2 n=1 Tax=Cylas formicarius TaxID=197179 RepID=UPI002958CCC7|nr:pancreatic triacylglycerol lipase-like isoform X2 [Cylas formicarius]
MNREGTTRIRIATLVIIFAIAIRASYQQDSNVSSVDADGKWEYFSKCYDEIGCVRTDSNWYDEKFRPVNLKPVDRRIIKTDFVFIKLNRTKDASLKFGVVTPDVKSIKGSGFIKNEILYILIHDFTSNGYTGWIKHISEILLARKYVNVVSIDWRHGAEPPYDQAVANARVVALEIINLIKVLREHLSLDLEKVHIIGHGVGAHIAGYVGSVFGKIKKISGLDPNGPRFEGMPDMVRLDPSDAQYVEVLHTDAFRSISQGSTYAFGHSDFFLNNAKEQPGCAEKDSKNILTLKRDSVGEGTIVPGCSHKRSFKYFIEALEERECTFLGIQCENYEKFSKGKCATCGSKCKTFGGVTYHDPEPASYFLNTGIQYPYCKNLKQVLRIHSSFTPRNLNWDLSEKLGSNGLVIRKNFVCLTASSQFTWIR